jgi:hypothetical protein
MTSINCADSHSPYRIPLSSNISVPSLLTSHQGATEPTGGLPANSVICLNVCSRMSRCWETDMAVGFSCE